MKYGYSLTQGLQASLEVSGDSVLITEELYAYCLANLEVLVLTIHEDELRIAYDVEAYRSRALSQVSNVNYVIIQGVRIYDDEFPFLHTDYYTRSGDIFVGDVREVKEAVIARNFAYWYKRDCIKRAGTPAEIDSIVVAQ